MLFHIPVLDRYNHAIYIEAKSLEVLRNKIHADLMVHITRCQAHQQSDTISVLLFGIKHTNVHYLLNGDIREIYTGDFAVKHITPADIAVEIRRCYRTKQWESSIKTIVTL